jgi:protein-L-isoaspartate O-methyltransferase
VTTAPPLWASLVEGLAAEGVLDEPWWAAFLAVPREMFIPEVIWRDAGDDLVPLRRGDEPAEWLRRAYGPRYVVTQVDDGAPAGPEGRGRVATSSASRPDIVALMLDAGRVEPGMRVLEIGTGTGYTAALLAERLGARNVTTIEIDPTLAARVRSALRRAGYGDVTVITGDGAQGDPTGAPFDRVLSTVAAPRVPYAWVAQTRPGGLVLTPWSSAYEPAGLLSLTVRPEGTATGGLINTTISFMELRDQRIPRATITDLVHDADTPDVSHTTLHACHLCNDDAPFAISFQVPTATGHTSPPPARKTTGACGSSTPAPAPGHALPTSRTPVAGPATSTGHADSSTRSPPPTTGGTTPAGPPSPNGASPSPRRGSRWSSPTPPTTSTRPNDLPTDHAVVLL